MTRSTSSDRQLGYRASGPVGTYAPQRRLNQRENVPYENKGLVKDLKGVHRGPFKFYFSIVLLCTSVLFLGAFLWMKDGNAVSESDNDSAILYLLFSVVSFGWSSYIWIKIKRDDESDDPWDKEEEQKNRLRQEIRSSSDKRDDNTNALSEIRAKNIAANEGTSRRSTVKYGGSTKNKYHAAIRASSKKPSAATAKDDDSKWNLTRGAMKALEDLGVNHESFKRYHTRMRKFISKTILEKLAAEVNTSNNGLVDAFLTVPNYGHCKDYVRERINKLSESQIMSDHKGNGGVKFGETDWSHNEFPSDNEIVLHVISIMMSVFMTRGERDRCPDPVFGKKHLSIAGEDEEMGDPECEKGEIILCIRKNWTRFYVIINKSERKTYEAFPGNDGLYWALTLFFFLVKKEKDNALDGADLTGASGGLCFDYVFSDLHRHY